MADQRLWRHLSSIQKDGSCVFARRRHRVNGMQLESQFTRCVGRIRSICCARIGGDVLISNGGANGTYQSIHTKQQIDVSGLMTQRSGRDGLCRIAIHLAASFTDVTNQRANGFWNTMGGQQVVVGGGSRSLKQALFLQTEIHGEGPFGNSVSITGGTAMTNKSAGF